MTGLTIDNPVAWIKFVDSARVIPGDTIYLRGGTYSGDWQLGGLISGTADAPVTIKPYNGEPVTFDGSLQIPGNYIKIYDLDFTDTIHADPATITPGITVNGKGFYMYGCHIQKMHSSGVNWWGNGPGEISECWIEDNGYFATGNYHGYCIYTHNEVAGSHTIQRNLMRPKHERYSLHVFTQSNIPLYDHKIFDNVFDGAVHAGGGQGLKNFEYERNIHNGAWVQLGRYLWDEAIYQNDGTTIKDNIFYRSYFTIDTDDQQPPQPHPNAWANLTESGNVAWSPYRVTDYNREGYTTTDAPANWERFIPFTVSARWAGIQVTLTDGVFSAAIVDK